MNAATTMYIDEEVKGTKENLLCSGRGLCNYVTGFCNCFDGYGSSDGLGDAGSIQDCGYLEPFVPASAGSSSGS